MVRFSLINSENVRISIAEKGHTLRSFSKEIGVSHSFMSQIINGKRCASPVVAKKVADGLNVDITDIFFVESVRF